METLTFTATRAGVAEDEYAHVAALCADDPEVYVSFQRHAEDSHEDWAVYFEFNDPINSDYECIEHCTLSRCHLHVDLMWPVDKQRRITAIDIEIRLGDVEFKEFLRLFHRVFWQRESLITIVDNRK